eukprot:4239206-Pyramimonas_sp.AAC.1
MQTIFARIQTREAAAQAAQQQKGVCHRSRLTACRPKKGMKDITIAHPCRYVSMCLEAPEASAPDA